MAVDAFPLQWPAGWKRTPANRRERGSFDTAFAKARDGLMAEIGRMGGRLPVLSSNMVLRRDGLPYAQQPRIEDPGIAVYFGYKGQQMCFACDRYATVEANTQAIRKTIEALRGIERWGASDMMERAFTGFAQLAAPADVRTWWQVLDVFPEASASDIRAQYQRLRARHHPDRGGKPEDFRAVQTAYEQAVKEGRA
ncbi:DnaJ domain-containing protein [Pseudoxanthomonas sp. X-1]|uniref:DnaJ domain-containing protein n=1 Tax=Pseudoxanthomonas sp. X-1 TaxID=2571115 RepID=UPI001CC3CA7B|nr:DnaJ domain-containing protein [Pseudoxanthomonas sp. X-1]